LSTFTTFYQLRPLALTDADALRTTCWIGAPLDVIEEMLKRVIEMMEQGRALGLVATVNDCAIGYGQLTRWPRVAEISDLTITENLRNRGIGTAMIHHLIGQARAWGMPAVEIGSAVTNTGALALYRRLGFAEDRRVELNLGAGKITVIYLKMPLV
jgi:ribosomal protein S18 acetylase RimI-like enzyme